MDFGFYFLEFIYYFTCCSTIQKMALRSPRRLPKSLNRSTSPYSLSIARKHARSPDRMARRKHERRLRFFKRCSKFASLVASELRAWLIIGIGTIVVAILLALLFSPFFDVRQITIQRQDPRIDLAEVQQLLSPLFRQRLILITRNQVASILKPQFPDIDTISIEKEYPSTLIISMTLEPVVARVLIDDSDTVPAVQSGALVESGSYAYVTRSGLYVLSPIALASSTPIPLLHFTDWGIRPQNRSRIVASDFMEKIFVARDILRADFGLTTLDIVVYVRAQEFHIRTNKTTFWFDLKSTLPAQFQRLRQFLKNMTLDQAKQYIDLRIEDKIIFQ